MGPEELRSQRERLESRRRQLLELSRRAETGIQEIRGEREIEFGDEAQSEEAQQRLESLEEAERGELARIDAALERMEAGQYGICRSCREPIEPRRLAAVPLALECAECASAARPPIRP